MSNRLFRSGGALLLILAVILLVSCVKKSPESHVFRATILEINNGTLIVEPAEGAEERKSSDRFSIGITNMPASPEPQVGDVIEITYGGEILEIYPASLSGITKIEIVEQAEIPEPVDPEPEESNSEPAGERVFVDGPYGRISIVLPENWSCESSDDAHRLLNGLYGLILKPEREASGRIELNYVKNFAVCGTGLAQEEMQFAGVKVTIGTYDEGNVWDYAAYHDALEGVVALTAECDDWSEDSLNEANQILNSVEFDPEVTAGAAYEFVRESESDKIGVMMDLHDITPTGAVVRFYQYDTMFKGELLYGQAFQLLQKVDGEWQPVPTIIEDYGFTEEGYGIPNGGESEMETNWEWLYGELGPGTYRIRKTVIEIKENGNEQYPLEAQFLIAGPAETEESSDFDVSNPKFNWINWDADGDGEEEELSFEYHDLGDEAPSYIEIILYKGSEQVENILDRAYALRSIQAKEDKEGPYLVIDYDQGDYYSHDAEGRCFLRYRDGEIILEEEE